MMTLTSKKPRRKIWLFVILAVLLAACIEAVLYLRPYEPDERAAQAMQSGGGVTVTDAEKWMVFEKSAGADQSGPGIVFYPGGLVKPESYAPLARELALRGYRTVIVRMPLNLAVLGGNRAEEALAADSGRSYVIGGHSLGGVMAARYAAAHPQQLQGVFMLAAYADSKGSLKDKGLPVLSLTGTEDGVLNRESWEAGRSNLPADAVIEMIPGGNHAQFGSYGLQKGDHPAAISVQEQTAKTADAIANWLAKTAE
ncbi:alpha/beta hydrolase [Paenibacillus lutrae]